MGGLFHPVGLGADIGTSPTLSAGKRGQGEQRAKPEKEST
jgi:hypothetical protein